MTERHAPSGKLRPARWAWTTAAATILLALVLFIVIWMTSDMAQRHPFTTVALEVLERGIMIGLLPSVVIGVLAWRVRRRTEGMDETVAATFGFLSVVLLGFGLVLAVLEWPSRVRYRLTLEAGIACVGGTLLVVSVWVRHIPRPWWPRGGVSG